MKDYYFRYIVTGSIEREFKRFRPAIRSAEKHEEKVFLTTFSKFNSYHEPYDEVQITSAEQIKPAKKKLIASFYKLTGTQPMSQSDYYIAYKFLRVRATKQGELEPFRHIYLLPELQQNRIFHFLKYNHNVRFF